MARNLRQTLYSLGLWALGIINAVFIASFVMKYLPADSQEPISAIEEVSVPNATAALKLEILNGCGAQGIGKKFADFLERSGFAAVNVDNFDNFDMPNTIIVDRKSKNRLLGLRVAESLGLPASAVTYQEEQSNDADVTIVIGKDYPKVDFLRERN